MSVLWDYKVLYGLFVGDIMGTAIEKHGWVLGINDDFTNKIDDFTELCQQY